MLSVLSSGFRFNDSNYDYDYTNTNVSSRLSLLSGLNRANMAKNKFVFQGVGSCKAKATF